ncbi:UNVERIFIED_CONTAM: Transposon Tf2-12 polyprotein [Sesamum angustifolium]|uniref:Transposon Tf2-12 polyprotein n=1 Tax=Sesamum angustifolium TaxID=2727405 RepID=A0AAW2NIT5_9LAMI
MIDLHGISPDVITHRLSVNPNAKPVNQAIKEEVDKLLKAKMQNVEFSGCVPRLQPNSIGSGRPRKNKLCHGPRSLLLLFGLKNAGVTYQHVNDMFQNQIGRKMEVYIDDVLVKSVKEQDHIKDLEECFQILKTFGMKLNLAKCTFRPNSIKEVQKLTGRLAALTRFISPSADKGLPFFKILRCVAKFEWNKTSQETFDELKSYYSKEVTTLLPISPSDRFDEPSFEISVSEPEALWKDGQVRGGVK